MDIPIKQLIQWSVWVNLELRAYTMSELLVGYYLPLRFQKRCLVINKLQVPRAFYRPYHNQAIRFLCWGCISQHRRFVHGECDVTSPRGLGL